MTRTDSLIQANKTDTQDSQAIYEALRDELGVRFRDAAGCADLQPVAHRD